MTHRVYVTRPLPDPGTGPLREAGLEVVQNEHDRPPFREELLARVGDADALLCLLTEKIDAEVLDAAPGLRVVANLAVGYDNVDVGAATARGIVVTNTPDVLTEATADLAWTLLLSATRRVVEGDRLVRAGRWTGWSPTQLLGRGLDGKTLGVVGLGKIGTAVARRATGFGMDVVYHNRSANEPAERELGVRRVELDELLATADFVSVNCPLTAETRHLLDADAFAAMKPTAVLVNTARGPVVDEKALVTALRDGTIAGAGLDVYEREPEFEPELAELDNVVLLPHLGSATAEARGGMVDLCCRNILAVLRGETPVTPVNDVEAAR